jgi:hypothetical protein
MKADAGQKVEISRGVDHAAGHNPFVTGKRAGFSNFRIDDGQGAGFNLQGRDVDVHERILVKVRRT